jgi:hypothetical protein
VNEKTLPLPGALSTEIDPPILSTIDFATERPTPVPAMLAVCGRGRTS